MDLHDYAEMRRGINDLMAGYDPIPDTGTTATYG